MPEVDPRDFSVSQANEAAAEAAKATEKPSEQAPKAGEGGDSKPAVETKVTEHPGPSARDRRRERQLQREAGIAEGKAQAYREMLLARGIDPDNPNETLKKETSGVPKRDDFKTDAEYTAALVTHELSKREPKSTEPTEEEKETQAAFTASAASLTEDAKSFDNWDEILKKGEDLELTPSDNPSLFYLFATSEHRGWVLAHFAQNPDVFDKLVEMEGNPVAQQRAFSKIEGKLEALYGDKKKPETKTEEKKTAVQRDASKAAPSSSIAPNGGTASDGTIPMFLRDNVINPAWVAQENIKNGVRP